MTEKNDHSNLPTPDAVRNLLRAVIDPEIGVNIVDLGLVYDVQVTPALVSIAMTMTSPACPMSDLVLDDAESTLAAALPDGPPVKIDLVWTPPWEPAMMSDKARGTLEW